VSGQLAVIPSPGPNYGTMLCSIEIPQFRETCPLLCKLDIPVRLICPDEIYSSQTLLVGLLLIGSGIEDELIKINSLALESGNHTYIFCVNINCKISNQMTNDFYNCDYTWDSFTMSTRHYHGPVIHDLGGNAFRSLSQLLEKRLKLD
jgi:hypothetical protein